MKTATMAATLALMAGAADASMLVDFTNSASVGGDGFTTGDPATQTFAGGLTVTVRGFPNPPGLSNPTPNAPSPAPTLAGATLAADTDGFGVGNDEVTEGRVQRIEVAFSRDVFVEGLAFLDLFKSDIGTEQAEVEFFLDSTSRGTALFDAIETDATDPFGYLAATGGFFAGAVDTIVYTARDAAGLRDDNDNDYSVAAVTVSPVPLPAAGLVLLTALGGAAAAYRRRKG